MLAPYISILGFLSKKFLGISMKSLKIHTFTPMKMFSCKYNGQFISMNVQWNNSYTGAYEKVNNSCLQKVYDICMKMPTLFMDKKI